MKIQRIQVAPTNKVTTKILLRDAKVASSYLQVDEHFKDVKELYFAVVQFMDNIGTLDDAFPITYGYERKMGYIMRLAEGWAIKWNETMYCEGDVLGIVKDKEMI